MQKDGTLLNAQELEIPGPNKAGVRNPVAGLSAFLREARQVWKEEGIKALIRRYGWRLVAVLFIYYLVRDSILYILLPYLIARGLLQ